jgi:hypothetical protein
LYKKNALNSHRKVIKINWNETQLKCPSQIIKNCAQCFETDHRFACYDDLATKDILF